jgi:hypothetical protein
VSEGLLFGPIGLACRWCDTDAGFELDSLTDAVGAGWAEIDAVDEADDWYNHVGTCPDCQAEALTPPAPEQGEGGGE